MEKKILRICLSKELPSILERDTNYLYLLYDKLLLFFGQNPYYDPFVICESMPDSPISGCLYILFDGSVKAYIGDKIVEIAEIEESEQAEQLKLLGTTFFIMADRRYLDLQYRTLQLPYHNGTYSMTVSLANDLKINDKTVVRYDPSKENFYIEGEYAGVPDFRKYKGKKTNSINIEVGKNCIHGDVKVSSDARNIITITDRGLFATIDIEDKITADEFNKLVDEYKSYKNQTETLMNTIKKEINDNIDVLINENTILSMVKNAVETYHSDLDELLDYYASISEKLKQLEKESKEYTDKVFEEKATKLQQLINDSLKNDVWGIF